MTSRDDLVAANGGTDAFARLDPPEELAGWVLTGRVEASEHAVAFVRTSARRAPSLTTWGPGVTVLLRALRDAGETGRHDVASVTVPTRVAGTAGTAGAGGTAADVFDLGDGGDWHWAWTDRAPAPTPGEADLVELDDHADAARLEAFGFAHNPLFEGFPGTGQSTSWLAALADDGSLLACGAVQRLPSGVAHLGGIVVARHAAAAASAGPSAPPSPGGSSTPKACAPSACTPTTPRPGRCTPRSATSPTSAGRAGGCGHPTRRSRSV